MAAVSKHVLNVIKWIEEAKEEGNEDDYQDYLNQAKQLLAKGKKQLADYKVGTNVGMTDLRFSIAHLEEYLGKVGS
jgi:hypothetical protein